MRKIKEIADAATVARHMKGDGDDALFLQILWAAPDPDARFQDAVRSVLRGPQSTQVYRRQKLSEFRELLGVAREDLKAYLVAAGIVNSSV